MKLAYWLRHSKSEKQLKLQSAICAGYRQIQTVTAPEVSDYYDGIVMIGIGGLSRKVYDSWLAAGKVVIFLDKGYTRGDNLRVSVNSFQPLAYFQKHKQPSARFDKLGLKVQPYSTKAERRSILLDGASNKYCVWHGLPHYHDWGMQVVSKIRQHSTLPIIYRPRPSHNEEKRIAGTKFSLGRDLQYDFDRAKVVVSHGGNIGFDATVAGIPHFAIDETIARPISETDWNKLDRGFTVDDKTRHQWFCDVAYCQWSAAEFESGAAWEYVLNVVEDLLGVVP